MAWFKRLVHAVLDEPTPVNTEVVAAVVAMHSEIEALKLEWAQTLDFIQRWANRAASRRARDIQRSLDEDPPLATAPVPLSDPGAGAPPNALKADLRAKMRDLLAARGREA